MPMDDNLYWNSADDDSSSTHEPVSGPYVDPWDLENYAYIRDHLDSVDLNSGNPSPCSGSSSRGGRTTSGTSAGTMSPSEDPDFTAEANSNSFYYVPAQKIAADQNYAAIDEIREDFHCRRGNFEKSSRVYSKRRANRISDSGIVFRNNQGSFDSADDEENLYEENPTPLMDFATTNLSGTKSPRDRSLSFAYGDRKRPDYALPIYDDIKSDYEYRSRKPRNFGLSNYGHLKIDYSYSWNNLDKYICH